jgi:hypothetical protein
LLTIYLVFVLIVSGVVFSTCSNLNRRFCEKRAMQVVEIETQQQQRRYVVIEVLPLDMVENSTSPSERISGGFSPHSIALREGMLHPRDLLVHLLSSS